MDEKGILNMLSSIECDLFYAIEEGHTNGIDERELRKFHDKIDDLLNEWHDITGATL